MSTTTQRPTPEVNAHRDEMRHYEFDEELALTYELAKRLECARDEAREYAERCKQGCINLSFAIDRIDYACGEPNEFEVSDYALHQNEEHVVQRVKEKFEAMREAIREAEALLVAVDNGAQKDVGGVNWYNRRKLALAKLQPFIKP